MNSTVFNSKNKFLLCIIAVILIIPAILAIYFTFNMDASTVYRHRMTAVEVFAQTGEHASFTEGKALDVYADAVTNAGEITENYVDLSAGEHKNFVVRFTENDGVVKEYNFYLANSAESCIFTDAENNYYMFAKDDAAKLLQREEFLTVNSFAAVPKALITHKNGEITLVSASGGSWSYAEAGTKKYSNIEVSNNADSVIKAGISDVGTLSFECARQPSEVTVFIRENGALKHEGAYETLLNSEVMQSDDTLYDIEIKASWEQTEGVDFFGELTYSGKLFYDVTPTFELIHSGSAPKGDFTILKLKNFNDGDKLFAECDYPMPEELQVFKNGDESFAFIPAKFSPDHASGKYKLTLSLENGYSDTLDFTVKPGTDANPQSQEFMIDGTKTPSLQEAFKKEAFEELENVIKEKTASSNAEPLWDGKFIYPNKATSKQKPGEGMADFGTKRTVTGLYAIGHEYIHEGIDLDMAAGSSVYAANNGKVVFAGELAYTGNSVIIDHGCSVYTYYYHLDSISVSEGDVVVKSGVIGKAGSTGFAAAKKEASCVLKSQLHFAASVDGVYMNPYYLVRYGVVFE